MSYLSSISALLMNIIAYLREMLRGERSRLREEAFFFVRDVLALLRRLLRQR